MAIVSGMCRSFKNELLRGIHDLSVDTINIALYTSAASLGPETTAYSVSNEATGTNWAAGGVALSVASGYPQIDSRTGAGIVAFQDLLVSNVTLTFRAVLLYNASKANRAIAVLDKGIDVVLLAGPLAVLNNPNSPNLITIA